MKPAAGSFSCQTKINTQLFQFAFQNKLSAVFFFQTGKMSFSSWQMIYGRLWVAMETH